MKKENVETCFSECPGPDALGIRTCKYPDCNYTERSAPLPVQEQGGKMYRFVKAGERLPDEDGQICVHIHGSDYSAAYVRTQKDGSRVICGMATTRQIWPNWKKNLEWLEEYTPPTSQSSYVVEKKIVLEGTYFVGECGACGFKASSGEWEGCHAIADTGDYGDPICPICGSKELEEADDDIYIDQRDMLIARIKELRDLYENLYWDNHMKSYNAAPFTPPDKEDKPVLEGVAGPGAVVMPNKIPDDVLNWIEGQADYFPSAPYRKESELTTAWEDGYSRGYSDGTSHMYLNLYASLSSIKAERDEAMGLIAGYKEWGKDVKKLSKEIGDALDGDQGALQPSLCDLVSSVKELREQSNEYRKTLESVAADIRTHRWKEALIKITAVLSNYKTLTT